MDTHSDIDVAVIRAKAIEKRLGDELGATGKNLYEKTDSLAAIASRDFIQRARRISATRNQIVFDPSQNKLPNRQRFLDDCIALEAEITELKTKLQARRTKGSGCFIATAVYGNYESPEVRIFRRFRDKRLAHHPLGRTFISIYYTFSPPLAAKVARSPLARSLLRSILDRLASVIDRHS